GSELRAIGLALSPDEVRSVVTRLKTVGYTAAARGDVLVVTPEDAR
ncbi:MAG: hypothetical protein K0R89_3435, partial [Ramlibacter sp.]|nr:hypothetical protein [Ramlibacter sp.]